MSKTRKKLAQDIDILHTIQLDSSEVLKLSALSSILKNTSDFKLAKASYDSIKLFVSQHDTLLYYAKYLFNQFQDSSLLAVLGEVYMNKMRFSMDATKQKIYMDKANDYLSRAIAYDSLDYDSRVRLGLIYVESPSPMQGIFMIRSVLEQYPKHKLALFNLGVLSLRSAQVASAKKYFSALLEVDSTHVEARLYWAISLIKTGEQRRGLQELRDLKKRVTDPNLLLIIDSEIEKYN